MVFLDYGACQEKRSQGTDVNLKKKYRKIKWASIGEADHESICGYCLSGCGQTSFTVELRNEKVYWL